MAPGVTEATYCTREDVKRALDIKDTSRNNFQVDRAIQSSARDIDRYLKRQFYPLDTTHLWDWPNFQRAYPWRVWFDERELADTTVNVPVVTSGGLVIPAADIFWGPWNGSPPYTFLELNRGSNAAFNVQSTPQQSISIAGTFGYSMDTDAGGVLAAAVSSTTATTITVTDASLVGVGNVLFIDAERLLVQDRAATATTQTIVSGGTTELASDNAITVSSGSALAVDETLEIDSEQMLVQDITGDVVTVKRGWNGTVLATHSPGATINAYRLLTVMRGQLGTTAATHLDSAAVLVSRPPRLIRDLALAESIVRVAAETGGYAAGGGEGGMVGLAAALPDLWDEAEVGYGRKARHRVV